MTKPTRNEGQNARRSGAWLDGIRQYSGFLLGAMGIVGMSCSTTTSPPSGNSATLQVVNAATSAGAVSVYVDGVLQGSTVATAASSGSLSIAPGTRTVELRSAGGAGFTRTVTFAASAEVVVVGLDSMGRVASEVLSDTNAIVPAGASKLRVVHMAANSGPIDIWRTQPDYGTPIRVQFPFYYRATSPYLQSTPGSWRIFVSDTVPAATPNAPLPDTLADTGPIAVPNGNSATVVVVDRPGGGVAFVVVRP